MNEPTIQESSNSDLIRSRIFTIRGVQVMLDRDLAELYGVEVSQLNRQVKRNIERFPDDFMFQLTREECSRCQIGILNGSRGSNIKPKVVSCPLIDEMTPRLSKAPYPTLSIKLGHYQSRVVRSSI